MIKSEHTVVYNTNEKADNTTDDTLDVSYTNTSGSTNSATVNASEGVTFIAQWEYLQEAVAMTKRTNEATYKESSIGTCKRI